MDKTTATPQFSVGAVSPRFSEELYFQMSDSEEGEDLKEHEDSSINLYELYETQTNPTIS